MNVISTPTFIQINIRCVETCAKMILLCLCVCGFVRAETAGHACVVYDSENVCVCIVLPEIVF